MADYISPKPVDPFAYQPHAFLRISCRCGRKEIYPLGDFARVHSLPGELKLYQLIKRLRCVICMERPVSANVWRYP
ncbi:MAG: hypothetical protein KKE77_13925 [Alphaproteobacteria bacterium]|nr:hypothetical protein [Gammaproteobacteria bacterium]MBU2342328.1 hypothetical protein [Alphaproteobacteria bacterium]